MQRMSHLDRLRLLGGIVRPVSESLAEQASDASDCSEDLPHRLNRLSSLGGDSSLSHAGSSFLSSLADQDANTQPMGLPPEAMPRPAQLPGREFEYLRQTVLQRSAQEFTELPIRLQAIARMGGLIYTERKNLEPRTYHLFANGVLLGILDRRKSRFYSRRHIASMDLSDLHCVMRPAGVDKPSSDMELMPVQDAVWLYGMHDPEALLDLPAEMGTHWLHLRKLPSVSTHLLLERHLTLIRLLLIREHSFDQLLHSTPQKDPVHLLRDLASLLLTRAIEPLPAHAKYSGLKPGLPYKVSVVKR
jgi:hypothetical protein